MNLYLSLSFQRKPKSLKSRQLINYQVMKKFLIGVVAIFSIAALNVFSVENLNAGEAPPPMKYRTYLTSCPDGMLYYGCRLSYSGDLCEPHNVNAPC